MMATITARSEPPGVFRFKDTDYLAASTCRRREHIGIILSATDSESESESDKEEDCDGAGQAA